MDEESFNHYIGTLLDLQIYIHIFCQTTCMHKREVVYILSCLFFHNQIYINHKYTHK